MTQQQLKLQQGIITQAHHRYRGQLKRYASSKVGNPQLVEDLLQDTFLKAWKFLWSGGKVENMKSFLYQILHNLIIDAYRRGNEKVISLNTLVEKGFEPIATSGEFEHISDVIEGKKMMLLIRKLPNLYRDALTLRYVDHLSLEEISHKVGQSRNTISVQIHRGLSKLNKLGNLSTS